MKTILKAAFILTLCLGSFAAQAQEEKRGEVPFRTDSGLINAEYYLATGKYMQALDVLNGVLLRHPLNADAYTYRGYAYEQMNELKRAKENYDRALQIDPTHLGANKYTGAMLIRAGKLDRAMEQMQAIRLICGATGCAELDELESDMNLYKKEKKAKKKD